MINNRKKYEYKTSELKMDYQTAKTLNTNTQNQLEKR